MSKKSLNTSVLARLNVNKSRTFLVIFSLAVAIVCLTISGFISYTVKETDTLQFANTSNNTVFANVTNSNINSSNVSKVGEYFSASSYNYFSKNDLGSAVLGQMSYLFESLEVGKLQEKMILPSFTQYGATEYTKLIGGRLVNGNDIALGRNFILVHNAIGKFVFGNGSPIVGEKIELSGIVYEVVGILNDTPDILRLIKMFNYDNVKYASSWTKIPLIIYGGKSSHVGDVLLFFDGSIKIDTLGSMQKTINNSNLENVFLTTAEYQIVNKSYSGTASSGIIDISLNIVTVILCIISTIIIFISIKERASEIAVRKSFGATTTNIVAMFLSEVVVGIFIAVCYGLPVATIIMTFISHNISKNLNTFVFPLNWDIFIFPIAVITLTICVLALIPLLVFSKSKIVNLLKVT
ncbi:MAG: ABC transporter permease [Christensenellaceae bacterium]|jgi:putative ABC transport system permease protein|nr:ABC transporter permease [Christensenellaceae bacterium]